MKESIPVKDKFLLTINEASEYFNIGQKNMRRIAENHLDSFGIFQGKKNLSADGIIGSDTWKALLST